MYINCVYKKTIVLDIEILKRCTILLLKCNDILNEYMYILNEVLIGSFRSFTKDVREHI